MRAVFLENILLLKVCFKAITNAKNRRITKEGLQRIKGYKGEMNKSFLKLANIWSITNSKALRGAEAAPR